MSRIRQTLPYRTIFAKIIVMSRPTRTRALQNAVRPVIAAEPLEQRRLLAVTFNSDTGVLTVNTGADADIIQFETQGDDGGVTGFRIIESVAGAALNGTDKQDFIDYINAGTGETASDFFPVPDQGEAPAAGDVRRVVVTTNIGDDLIIAGNTLTVPIDVNSGSGNDTISGGPRADTIIAEDGDDSIFGGGGGDVMTGGDGDDIFVGGEGSDTVDYRTRTTGVNVTIDGLANDGDLAAGENDLVSTDIETVVGGTVGDVLQGGNTGARIILIGRRR